MSEYIRVCVCVFDGIYCSYDNCDIMASWPGITLSSTGPFWYNRLIPGSSVAKHFQLMLAGTSCSTNIFVTNDLSYHCVHVMSLQWKISTELCTCMIILTCAVISDETWQTPKWLFWINHCHYTLNYTSTQCEILPMGIINKVYTLDSIEIIGMKQLIIYFALHWI